MKTFILRLFGRVVPAPALSSECQHVYSNWSAPTDHEVEVTAFSSYGSTYKATKHTGYEQHRSCLKCNLYEQRVG